MSERLKMLKESKFLKIRILERISENMHYEIYKFLDAHELLEIRSMSLGGYELTSNKVLRSRIRNYLRINCLKYLPNNTDIIESISLILEQTGSIFIPSQLFGTSYISLTALAYLMNIEQSQSIFEYNDINNMKEIGKLNINLYPTWGEGGKRIEEDDDQDLPIHLHEMIGKSVHFQLQITNATGLNSYTHLYSQYKLPLSLNTTIGIYSPIDILLTGENSHIWKTNIAVYIYIYI